MQVGHLVGIGGCSSQAGRIQSPSPKSALCWRSKQRLRRDRRESLCIVAAGPNLLQKLGRVLKEKAAGDLDRVFKGTSKTRERLGVVEELFTYWNLDATDESLEELEEALIAADFGPKTAIKVVDQLRDQVLSGQLKTGEQIRTQLKRSIVELLEKRGGSSSLDFGDGKPGVLLIIGVNGGGKTTTIGKLAHKFVGEGASVLLAAGDTFRAAAAEQLQTWADRAGADFYGPKREKHRPDALLYEAVRQAEQQGNDLVVCDTSGRLHTNIGLMEELAKCRRSIAKKLPGAPHESLLVLDGTTGLNMLNQAREFNEVVPLTGLILTKLDGTARGGAVISVIDELGIPIKFVGVGEGINDLQPFDATIFVDALFPEAAVAAATCTS